MGSANEVIALLKVIAASGENVENLDKLVDFIEKISKATDKVHVEINYDGCSFSWKVTQTNVTASEWLPRAKNRI